jgi:hypothetical protein
MDTYPPYRDSSASRSGDRQNDFYRARSPGMFDLYAFMAIGISSLLHRLVQR